MRGACRPTVPPVAPRLPPARPCEPTACLAPLPRALCTAHTPPRRRRASLPEIARVCGPPSCRRPSRQGALAAPHHCLPTAASPAGGPAGCGHLRALCPQDAGPGGRGDPPERRRLVPRLRAGALAAVPPVRSYSCVLLLCAVLCCAEMCPALRCRRCSARRCCHGRTPLPRPERPPRARAGCRRRRDARSSSSPPSRLMRATHAGEPGGDEHWIHAAQSR